MRFKPLLFSSVAVVVGFVITDLLYFCLMTALI